MALTGQELSDLFDKYFLKEYAVKNHNHSRYSENSDRETYRSLFHRDRDKIIHSKAFLRLHCKTQVIGTSSEQDELSEMTLNFFRNRMTHTIEVSQIAKSLSEPLQLNSYLTEAISLGHDLCHTPFGHAGERALNNKMAEVDKKFLHSIQAVRYINSLSSKVAKDQSKLEEIDRHINDGILKHDLDHLNLTKKDIDGYLDRQTGKCFLNDLFYPGTLEAQVVYWSDKIAYIAHDFDDFCMYNPKAKLNKKKEKCIKDQVKELFQICNITKTNECKVINSRNIVYHLCSSIIGHSSQVLSSFPSLNFSGWREYCKKLYIDNLKQAVKVDLKKYDKSQSELDELATKIIHNEYRNDKENPDIVSIPLDTGNIELEKKWFQNTKKRAYVTSFAIGFDSRVFNQIEHIKKLLRDDFIKSSEISRSDQRSEQFIGDLFDCYKNNINLLPISTKAIINKNPNKKERIIADHIAGMTDQYAIKAYSSIKLPKLLYV